MSLDPEDDLMAAEFALGTLSASERATLAARRLREPQLDAAIKAWEARLAPLAEATPPIPPSRDYLADIKARIRAAVAAPPSGARDDLVTELRARVARWRAAAIAASAIAAVLLVGAVGREISRETPPSEFVAVLQKSPDSPAFAVSVDLETREFTVRPVAAPAARGKAYELWIIDPKLGSPRSLGLIDAAEVTRASRLKAYDRTVVVDATYAVTIEPPGGSPNGQPSGPPVYVGKLIPVGP